MSAKSKRSGATAPLRRTGLQRLSCPEGCETFAYLTVAAIERGRLPLCPDCAGRLLPDHPELAAKVLGPEEWDRHPWLAEFVRQCASIDHGQAAHIQRGRNVQQRDTLAAERVAEMLRAEYRARQLAGLVQFARAQEPEEVPF